VRADAVVGRGPERASLMARLVEARGGRGSLVLVEGEAGAGKTTFADAVARDAAARGVRVAWGACRQSGMEPYLPWTQILSAVGGRAQKLVGETTGDSGSRARLFEEVIDDLRDAWASDGLFIVIDDAQWADVASLQLLEAVAGVISEAPVVLAVLYRQRDAASRPDVIRALASLRHGRGTVDLTMGGLGPADIDELAAIRLGRMPSAELLAAVHQRSAGNPLFVIEMVRMFDRTGRADGLLPAGVRDVIAARLDQLGPADRAVLRCAAVVGPRLPIGRLAAVLRRPHGELAAIVERLAAAEFLVIDGPTIAFDHEVTREVAYRELPMVERQHWHAEAARVIAAEADDSAADEVAHHLRWADPVLDAAKALTATLSAAQRARRALAYEHAAGQYREALDLLVRVPGADVRRADLLLDLARCQFRSRAFAEAWRSCREAADLGRAGGDWIVMADAACVIRGVIEPGLNAELHSLCREVLPALHGIDRVREARVLAQLVATADPWAGDVEAGLSDHALALAEETGDEQAVSLALQARHDELINPAHAEQRIAIADRAVQLGRRTGTDEHVAWGLSWRMDACVQLGARAALDADLTAFTRLVRHMREPLWLWRLMMIQASMAALEGRFDAALALAEEALVVGRRGGHEGSDLAHLLLTSHVAVQTGDGLDDIERAVSDFAARGPYLTRAWRAGILCAMGMIEAARAIWREVVPHLDSMPSNAAEWLVATAGNADLCCLLGDVGPAPSLYAALAPYADCQVAVVAHAPSSGPVAIPLGRLAGLLGDHDTAEAHLRHAVALSDAMGSPPFRAIALLDLATLLDGRNRPGNRRLADEHRRDAADVASRLGMGPLLGRATAPQHRGSDSVLTAREEQVAALVAEGLSNRQIATRLSLSERTVEHHVAHVLTRLGFATRASVAAWHTARSAKQ
jgi:DNA-binding CsgD family transcriptional regulator